MERTELITHFAETFRHLTKDVRTDLTVLFEGLIPFNEFLVLQVVAERKRLKVSEIADELNVTKSFITLVSEKLINKKLITRERVEKDRRIVMLVITREGNSLVEEMNEMKTTYFLKRLEGISNDEIIQINDLFKKIILNNSSSSSE
ncbi:MarR family winged helix-turn-helix transcriptional regulator [Jeotgalibacillus soli]|uniref:HTH marR-type domain-containing protein n=1 Tax=Jeotgalibacillus soli TaxID=889306 RepID=A0A0C2RU05_9BACL|nr:MarR family transcriptional regulator [Jeotgalibacillus soli]KIL45234.1 hypothetical protein KP78_27780 [Jeotgalibacillus soli]